MRRVAPLLADIFVRHGLMVEADAKLESQRGSGAVYTVPLAIRGPDGAILAIDGDFTGAPVDNVMLATFREACYDTGASGLFVHDGPLSMAAARAVGDRIHLWDHDAVTRFIGTSELNAALGLPLPAVPTVKAWPVVGAAARSAIPAAAAEPEPESEPPAPIEIDLPPSAAADVQELVEESFDAAGAVSEPFLELIDDTPVLHLEEADATVVEAEPAPATATEAPDVIALEDVPAPPPALPPAPAVDVLAEPVFEVPTVNDLLPPAFRAPPTPAPAPALEPAPEPLAMPAPFVAPEAPVAVEPDGAFIQPPDGSQGLLPPRVTLDEAKRMVADRLFSIEEAELILQPVHLFDYTVDLLQPGKVTSQPVTGRVQVNGTDRRVTSTDAGKTDPHLPHRVYASEGLTIMDKVLRVSPERAEQLATIWCTAEHAKTVHVTTNRADDSFELVERKEVGPTSGQVNLTPLGLWHRPFWRLWGSNGHADIDAVEGHVLDEEIKTPNPDFLMVE